ncbi:hypothetical protein ACBJ59_16575 [Nonomuraea sp. MTCD27]|uniref:hypothetical protein n=1 Tax=Nonomuraea sp. MTCD27 TaxID=1676747 RepID=UPI0035C17883
MIEVDGFGFLGTIAARNVRGAQAAAAAAVEDLAGRTVTGWGTGRIQPLHPRRVIVVPQHDNPVTVSISVTPVQRGHHGAELGTGEAFAAAAVASATAGQRLGDDWQLRRFTIDTADQPGLGVPSPS